MKYKLVAMDMDGTLLNSKRVITNETLFALKKAMASNVICTISTGRPLLGIKKYVEILGLEDSPVITYNGACVVNPKTEEILFSKDLLDCDARKIYELGSKYNVLIVVWSNNILYANRFDERLESYRSLSGATPVLITDFEEIIKQGISKILWSDEKEEINRYLEELNPNMFSNVTYVTSQPIFLEFFNKDVSKGIAVDFIAKKYGILQEEVVCIGDGLNDYEMIEYAGLGIAMGNADPEIKKIANYITGTNDEDGIASVIYEKVLNIKTIN